MDPAVLKGLADLGYGDDQSIPYAELVIPEEFQRKLKPRGWDTFIPALFGRAIVCQVGKRFYVVDGIHRIDEGNEAGMWADRDVPCVVYLNCTLEQASALFNLLNDTRVSLASADKFRSACFAGDVEARQLDADLLDIGLDGWCQGRAGGDGADLGAIGTVVGLVEKYGREYALYVLDSVSVIWSWIPGEDRYVGSPNIRILKGFGEYLRPEKRVQSRRRPRRWNRDDGPMLFEWIANNYPGEVGHESFIVKSQFRVAGGGGGGSAVGVELQIHDCFLKARREARGEDQ